MKLLGQLPDLLQAPLSSFEISMAYIIGGTIRGTVNGLLILLVGITLGGISVMQPFATVGFIILVSVAFSSIGFLLGQLADTWDQLATLQNFLLTPLSFLGGIFYSIKMLPDWAQAASFYNPIYYMINGLRFTILGVSDSPPMTSFIVALIMTVGFFLAAVLMMESGKKIKQ
jgi:ABC-2 type transport system permease protein